jgi:nicotinamidase-related amidase
VGSEDRQLRNGESRITVSDYASALVDELERGKFIRQRLAGRYQETACRINTCGKGEGAMTSEAIRDQEEDHLLTPRNAALIIIDYQPVQVGSVASMDRRTLVTNIVAVARTAKLYDLPIVLSTVNVNTGANQATVHQLADVLDGMEAIDRTTINAWEDEEFVHAVRTIGRKKLLMTALWTEACLTFPTLDAIREGYEVYPIVDAVGGTSVEAHRAALERIIQAGAKPTSWVQVLCELQRDWSRKETASQFGDILFAVEGR